MKFCKACNMNVNTQKSYCPLCGDMLVEVDTAPAIEFPTAKKYIDKSKMKFLNTLFLILSVCATLICISINIATYRISQVWWSVLVVLGIIYLWSLVKRSIMVRANIAKILYKQLILLSIILLCIDYFFSSFSGWSVTYVIPFLSMAMSVVITIIVLANLLHYRDYMHYALTILAIGIGGLVLLFFSEKLWPVIASTSVSVALFVVLLIVADKRILVEIKKRLHF